MKIINITCSILICAILSGGWFRHGYVDQIIIFAGQSDGITPGLSCSQITGGLSYLGPAISNVKISDMSGTFTTYQACSNSNPAGGGGNSQSWGPEAQFVYQWSQDNPTKTLYIIKNAIGSTPLFNVGNASSCAYLATNVNWSPSSNSTNCFTVTTNLISTAIANLAASSKTARVVGVMWMQGWTDAGQLTYANAYQTNLANFITSVRSSWASSNVPIVIERTYNQVGCSQPYVLTVQAAQNANSSSTVPVINTDNGTTYPLSGGCELAATGAVNLGAAMYTAYLAAR